jgi:hypothetical protein
VRALVLLLLAACPASQSGDASFRIFYPDPGTGHAGKRLFVKPVGDCKYADGRDAHWSTTGARVASGALPAGVTLEDGAIGGTPRSPGSTKLTIVFAGVQCAGKAYPDQSIDVVITVR